MLPMPSIVRPYPLRIAKQRFGSPVESTIPRSVKRNKELTKSLGLIGLSSNAYNCLYLKRRCWSLPPRDRSRIANDFCHDVHW